MDRLRAPGGCPWDARQTHDSLVQYLLEEAYEAAEAIEHGTRADLREELGDVLLQVVFHASIAAADAADPFDLDDLAQGVADKLVRRHPHVFLEAESTGLSPEESHRRWDRIKAKEKARRSALDGIPAAQSPLARAQKVFGRARRAGLSPDPPAGSALGDRLAALAWEADQSGLDAEKELRAATRRVEAQVRALEEEPKMESSRFCVSDGGRLPGSGQVERSPEC
ncbi:MAG: MazG family protein [Bifidobacteriaceae bacterium]|jgi:XTP/dITP diphosphohydrolase|nr:MazG family protein [Bifidobacteriaceae bacterium]